MIDEEEKKGGDREDHISIYLGNSYDIRALKRLSEH